MQKKGTLGSLFEHSGVTLVSLWSERITGVSQAIFNWTWMKMLQQIFIKTLKNTSPPGQLCNGPHVNFFFFESNSWKFRFTQKWNNLIAKMQFYFCQKTNIWYTHEETTLPEQFWTSIKQTPQSYLRLYPDHSWALMLNLEDVDEAHHRAPPATKVLPCNNTKFKSSSPAAQIWFSVPRLN